MGMEMIRLRPGVNAEFTASLNQAGISTSSLIRFRAGLPEKLGGWQKYVQFAVDGVPKAMHAWVDFNDIQYLSVGTTTQLANISDNQIAGLTPQTFTSDFTPDFDTTNLSKTVTVDDPNIANVTTLDAVEFKTPISVGGIILHGVYPIDVVTGTTTYRITAATAATSTVSNGGATPVFTITEDSTQVSVLLTAHGLTVAGEDTVNFPIPTAITITGNDSFTKSLVHGNGADASTTFEDDNAAGTARTWTAAGNAQVDTAQFKWGGASILFDGTGDWITTPDTADLTLGTNDFTWDIQVRPAVDGSLIYAAGQADSTLTAAGSAWYAGRTAANKFEFNLSNGSAFTTLTSTSNILAGAWNHIRIQRSGNTISMRVNNVQEASTAFSGTVPNSAAAYRIGAAGEHTSNPWNGWLDEIKLDNGVARGAGSPTAEYGEQAIEILGTYTVVSITDANNFVIAISALPDLDTVIQMNAGRAELVYYIAIGPSTAGTGYSTGTYSTGTYSIGVPPASQQMGSPIAAEDWTLDNWGETLLACPQGGGIYTWRPNTGLETAQLIAEGPLFNTGMFVSQQTQMVIAYGSTDPANIGLDRDPLLVKWCATGNFLAWAPGVATLAGSRRLSRGSKIVGGLSATNQELLWTDVGLWAMNFLGSLAAGVWGFNEIGKGCGLIGRHGMAALGAEIYWMSASNFYKLGQRVEVVPCTVWDVVYQDLNTTHQDKCWAWANTPFNEIWFFFPRASTSATQPDYYVKLNTLEGSWDHGPLSRTCGIDQSLLGRPIAATPGGLIYQHETSRNADGAALTASFTTGFFEISNGAFNMFVDWFLPDFKWNEYPDTSGASIQVTLYAQYYPGGSVRIYGPFTVTAATPYFNPRLRGRLVSMKVESSDLDSFWRLGGCRARIAPDGKIP